MSSLKVQTEIVSIRFMWNTKNVIFKISNCRVVSTLFCEISLTQICELLLVEI